MTQDKWHEMVADLEKIEAYIKRAMGRLEALGMDDMHDMRAVLNRVREIRLQAYRARIAAKVKEEDGK